MTRGNGPTPSVPIARFPTQIGSRDTTLMNTKAVGTSINRETIRGVGHNIPLNLISLVRDLGLQGAQRVASDVRPRHWEEIPTYRPNCLQIPSLCAGRQPHLLPRLGLRPRNPPGKHIPVPQHNLGSKRPLRLTFAGRRINTENRTYVPKPHPDVQRDRIRREP